MAELVKTVNGLAWASVKTKLGLAKASIKTWNGVDCTAAGGGFSTAVLAVSPTAYWRLGETSGTNANDEIGTNDGTYTGGYTLNQTGSLTGDSDPAISLNGSTGYVEVADSADLDATTSVTVAALVKLNSATPGAYMTIAGKSGGGSGVTERSYWLSVNVANKWAFGVSDGSSFYSAVGATALTTNWTFVVGVYDGSTLKVYVDGTEDASVSATGSMPSTGYPLAIGRLGGTNAEYLDGMVDEVFVKKDAALSSGQISTLNAAR